MRSPEVVHAIKSVLQFLEVLEFPKSAKVLEKECASQNIDLTENISHAYLDKCLARIVENIDERKQYKPTKREEENSPQLPLLVDHVLNYFRVRSAYTDSNPCRRCMQKVIR